MYVFSQKKQKLNKNIRKKSIVKKNNVRSVFNSPFKLWTWGTAAASRGPSASAPPRTAGASRSAPWG